MRWFATIVSVRAYLQRALPRDDSSLISLGGKPQNPTSGPADLVARVCIGQWARPQFHSVARACSHVRRHLVYQITRSVSPA